jgi:catechol 2,3-dioxygenase-like lactoylglutathione lyase family enzyme
VDYKLELVAIPVTDVDRAIAFYRDQAGFNIDHDHTVNDDLRFVQVTPPGSACSITFGKGITEPDAAPVPNLQCVVDSAEQGQAELRERGVDASDVDEQPWGRFVYFKDPDGNQWALQEIVRPG